MPLPIIAAATLAPILAIAGRYLLGYIIVRTVAILGIALISYGAVDSIAESVKSYMVNSVGGFPGEFAGMASSLGIFEAVNIITAAYIGAVTVRQVMGVYKRLSFGNTPA